MFYLRSSLSTRFFNLLSLVRLSCSVIDSGKVGSWDDLVIALVNFPFFQTYVFVPMVNERNPMIREGRDFPLTLKKAREIPIPMIGRVNVTNIRKGRVKYSTNPMAPAVPTYRNW